METAICNSSSVKPQELNDVLLHFVAPLFKVILKREASGQGRHSIREKISSIVRSHPSIGITVPPGSTQQPPSSSSSLSLNIPPATPRDGISPPLTAPSAEDQPLSPVSAAIVSHMSPKKTKEAVNVVPATPPSSGGTKRKLRLPPSPLRGSPTAAKGHVQAPSESPLKAGPAKNVEEGFFQKLVSPSSGGSFSGSRRAPGGKLGNKVLRSLDLESSQDFVKIPSPSVPSGARGVTVGAASPLLTEHQKEVMRQRKRTSDIPALYSDLSQQTLDTQPAVVDDTQPAMEPPPSAQSTSFHPPPVDDNAGEAHQPEEAEPLSQSLLAPMQSRSSSSSLSFKGILGPASALEVSDLKADEGRGSRSESKSSEKANKKRKATVNGDVAEASSRTKRSRKPSAKLLEFLWEEEQGLMKRKRAATAQSLPALTEEEGAERNKEKDERKGEGEDDQVEGEKSKKKQGKGEEKGREEEGGGKGEKAKKQQGKGEEKGREEGGKGEKAKKQQGKGEEEGGKGEKAKKQQGKGEEKGREGEGKGDKSEDKTKEDEVNQGKGEKVEEKGGESEKTEDGDGKGGNMLENEKKGVEEGARFAGEGSIAQREEETEAETEKDNSQRTGGGDDISVPVVVAAAKEARTEACAQPLLESVDVEMSSATTGAETKDFSPDFGPLVNGGVGERIKMRKRLASAALRLENSSPSKKPAVEGLVTSPIRKWLSLTDSVVTNEREAVDDISAADTQLVSPPRQSSAPELGSEAVVTTKRKASGKGVKPKQPRVSLKKRRSVKEEGKKVVALDGGEGHLAAVVEEEPMEGSKVEEETPGASSQVGGARKRKKRVPVKKDNGLSPIAKRLKKLRLSPKVPMRRLSNGMVSPVITRSGSRHRTSLSVKRRSLLMNEGGRSPHQRKNRWTERASAVFSSEQGEGGGARHVFSSEQGEGGGARHVFSSEQGEGGGARETQPQTGDRADLTDDQGRPDWSKDQGKADSAAEEEVGADSAKNEARATPTTKSTSREDSRNEVGPVSAKDQFQADSIRSEVEGSSQDSNGGGVIVGAVSRVWTSVRSIFGQSTSTSEEEETGPKPTASPDKLSASPEKYSGSANEPSVSPDKVSVLPDKPSVLPDEISVLPDEISVLPDEISVLPDEISVLPDEISVLPDQISVLPDKPSVSPDKASVLPDEIFVLPDKPVASPDKPSVSVVEMDNKDQLNIGDSTGGHLQEQVVQEEMVTLEGLDSTVSSICSEDDEELFEDTTLENESTSETVVASSSPAHGIVSGPPLDISPKVQIGSLGIAALEVTPPKPPTFSGVSSPSLVSRFTRSTRMIEASFLKRLSPTISPKLGPPNGGRLTLLHPPGEAAEAEPKPWVRHHPPAANCAPATASILKAAQDAETSMPVTFRRVTFSEDVDQVIYPCENTTMRPVRPEEKPESTMGQSDPVTEGDSKEILYPELVDCVDVSIDHIIDGKCVCDDRAPTIGRIVVCLRERGILTIGQLASLPISEVKKLPIARPKNSSRVEVLRKKLKFYQENRNQEQEKRIRTMPMLTMLQEIHRRVEIYPRLDPKQSQLLQGIVNFTACDKNNPQVVPPSPSTLPPCPGPSSSTLEVAELVKAMRTSINNFNEQCERILEIVTPKESKPDTESSKVPS
ncbi:unnamed protein product [Cyprideis torosa]|uniref:Uncharacterized protein n=1 Tax=Cyprideis torosa TaxID=163714 RepID=A0A7R8ZGE4_9CRUS|nr:unnamed protein product [Cyprideis torosa]CAG0881472.1 unnamed protein product [Cyprideis torosa]